MHTTLYLQNLEPKHRKEDTIKMNLEEIRTENMVWIHLTQGSVQTQTCMYVCM
jgi:hypothetical protein